ncbi:MAG: stage II sporulation protein M, partial [Planctomycetota bacterium]
TSVYHGSGIHAEYWAWILPHGVTELSAIVLCGGIGLLLGRAVVAPGLSTGEESLRRAGREAASVCLGIGGMLVFAAIVESYLRQSHLPTWARFAFAFATFALWVFYFANGVLRERAERTASNRDGQDEQDGEGRDYPAHPVYPC